MLHDPLSSDNFTFRPKKPEVGISALQFPLIANLLAIASLSLGILSILRLGLLSAALAIALGYLSRKNCSKCGIATAGMWCGGIAISLFLLLVLLFSNAGPPTSP